MRGPSRLLIASSTDIVFLTAVETSAQICDPGTLCQLHALFLGVKRVAEGWILVVVVIDELSGFNTAQMYRLPDL